MVTSKKSGALKIALVNPPQFTRYPQPPMGLAQIAAVLEREGYPITIVDANALGLKPKEVVTYIADADIVVLILLLVPKIYDSAKLSGNVLPAPTTITLFWVSLYFELPKIKILLLKLVGFCVFQTASCPYDSK